MCHLQTGKEYNLIFFLYQFILQLELLNALKILNGIRPSRPQSTSSPWLNNGKIYTVLHGTVSSIMIVDAWSTNEAKLIVLTSTLWLTTLILNIYLV